MEQPRDRRVRAKRWELDRVRYHLDKPPAPERTIRSLDDILKDVVEGLEQPVQENVLLLREAWPELVGSQIAGHSEPGFIQNCVLQVFVDHPGWLSELERIKRPLLQKLKAKYHSMNIYQLAFSLQHK